MNNTQQENERLARKIRVPLNAHYFPQESFLDAGYAPPGGYVKDFSIIRDHGRYHVFHIDGRPEERCGESGNELSFGHASTSDFKHWVRHRLPLAVGDRPWENEHVWAPYVTKWQDRFYMFYMASGKGFPGVITYAISEDLETWSKWQGGPIAEAEGRDPFVRYADGFIYLFYTASVGVRAIRSSDMVNWESSFPVIENPDRSQAESCSMHPVGHKFVLWYNDYYHCDDASGDFRAVYAFSSDPLSFDHRDLKVFEFSTALPTQYAFEDWVEKRPIPISIELVARGANHWLICYFRWHNGRFRLFFGDLDWSADRASITEILTQEHLDRIMSQVEM
jgi:hypothetical protein